MFYTIPFGICELLTVAHAYKCLHKLAMNCSNNIYRFLMQQNSENNNEKITPKSLSDSQSKNYIPRTQKQFCMRIPLVRLQFCYKLRHKHKFCFISMLLNNIKYTYLTFLYFC